MRFFILIVLAATFPAHAAVYKCVVDNQTVYSDKPCADEAEKLDIKVHQPNSRDIDSLLDRTVKMKRDSKIHNLKSKIRRQESKIDQLRLSMDKELAALKKKKSRSANNSAGATWENSISNEMSAVVSKYNLKISVAEAEITRHRDMLSQIGK